MSNHNKDFIMQTSKLLFVILLGIFAINTSAQPGQQLPSIMIQTLDGQSFNTENFDNEGKPFVLSFWATWCRPCITELTAIDEIYQEWLEEGFKLIAVSTDNARTRNNVLPMVNGRGWEFEFYIDENGDFQRAMGVNMIPHTFIFDGKGNLISQHRGFVDGMEFEMFDKLKSLLDEN